MSTHDTLHIIRLFSATRFTRDKHSSPKLISSRRGRSGCHPYVIQYPSFSTIFHAWKERNAAFHSHSPDHPRSHDPMRCIAGRASLDITTTNRNSLSNTTSFTPRKLFFPMEMRSRERRSRRHAWQREVTPEAQLLHTQKCTNVLRVDCEGLQSVTGYNSQSSKNRT